MGNSKTQGFNLFLIIYEGGRTVRFDSSITIVQESVMRGH